MAKKLRRVTESEGRGLKQWNTEKRKGENIMEKEGGNNGEGGK